MAIKNTPKGPSSNAGGVSDPTDTSKFEKIIAEEVSKRESPTFLGKDIPRNLEDRSYFRVYALTLDKSDIPILIAGNESQIALQASVFNALDNMLAFKSVTMDELQFKRWAYDFENCFTLYRGKGLPALASQWIEKQTPWGGSLLSKPRIVILKPDPKKKIPERLFNTVVFYPNFSNKNEFKFFTGSWQQIKDKIEMYWALKDLGGEGGGSVRLPAEVSQLSGHPYIEISFRQKTSTLLPSQQRSIESEFSFRLMDKIESPEDDRVAGSPISLADLKRYARAIKEIFFKDNKPFTFRRGKVSTTYNDWPRGYKLWCLVNSVSEGERVLKAVTSIQGHKFDSTKMTFSNNRNPAKAYPSKPIPKQILGEKKKVATRRGEADLEFRWARVVLPFAREKIVLVSNEAKMPVDPRLIPAS